MSVFKSHGGTAGTAFFDVGATFGDRFIKSVPVLKRVDGWIRSGPRLWRRPFQRLEKGKLCGLELAAIDGAAAEEFLDTEELVVLGDAVGAAHGTGFDLSAVGGDGDVGDGGILGFAGAV